MIKENPSVSVVVAVYNEEDFIFDCITSLLEQDYPKDKYNILIVDGNSSDRSRNIILDMAKSSKNIVLLENPMRKIAKAFNIGINFSSNDIIALMSAHAIAANNYISLCVKYLNETGAGNVGGIMVTEGKGFWGECIALGTSSTFGIGNSKHRYSDKSGYDDAGWPGAFWRTTLLDIGGFDESLGLNEDDDLNYRLVKSGQRLFHTPEIRTTYFCRNSKIRLWKQYYKYGFWKPYVIRKFGGFTSFRHFIPAAFVLSVILSTLIGIISGNYSFISVLLLTYFSISILISLINSLMHRKLKFVFLPFIYAILHLSYGFGFIAGLINSHIRR